MEVLASLNRNEPGIYIIAIQTALIRIMPKDYFNTTEFNIKVGQSITYENFRQNLVSTGYTQVDTVLEGGEFTTRGSLIDLYPSDSSLPYRIDLFGDEIESIKVFDPKTQRTIKSVDKINIHGASEYPLSTNHIDKFCKKWQERFPELLNHQIYKDIKAGVPAGGAEFFLPLFFNKMSDIFEYISDQANIYVPQNYSKIINNHLTHVKLRKKTCLDYNIPSLDIDDVYISNKEFYSKIENKKLSIYNNKPAKDGPQTHSIPLNIKPSNDSDELIKFCKNCPHKILISTTQEVRKNYYREKLIEAKLTDISIVTNWQEFLESKQKISLITSSLSKGCIITKKGIAIITEADIVDHDYQDYTKRAKKDTSKPELDLSNIAINDYVIHEDYGIGQYLGLTKISGTDDNNEYIKISYANDDKLYIPVTELDKIYSYRATSEPELARLGSKKWQNTKKKAIDKMIDSAADLLDLYSKRNLVTAKKYQKPGKDYLEFSHEFPFAETPDQAKAISEIIDSLTSDNLTDRLICGDVGFGKTEIAMRAAFLAVTSKLQVVMIAPTTLLASQHYNSFCERFANWPINISLYSGNISTKESNEISENVKSGKVDIIIATHKIFSNKLKFSNLGLLLIDEEHRFGVKQKEKLKELKLNVDVIALTATPIPRTLQLACTKLRDLSIIATPPQERLPIKTYISTFDEKLVIEAITREIARGGQVYYLYNEVAKINIMAEYLQGLMPNLNISVAHGQMPKPELTQAMTRFYNKQAHICLCSTIVESGIDIPNANTIIIDRADKLGLAQLHQIRGRVGRSSHQAYAYLFTPEQKYLTNEAKQRLEAIERNNTLGSGFQLAILDMEIRGAGELLGDEQSGHIKELGFDYYISLINDTTEAIKNNQSIADKLDQEQVSISTYFPIIIPEKYIDNPAVRLNTYKKIAKIKDEDHIFMIKNELEDIYGKVPESVESLLATNYIKSLANICKITCIIVKEKNTQLELTSEPNINTESLIDLVTKEPNIYKIKGAKTIEITHTATDAITQLESVIYFMNQILPTKSIEEIK